MDQPNDKVVTICSLACARADDDLVIDLFDEKCCIQSIKLPKEMAIKIFNSVGNLFQIFN